MEALLTRVRLQFEAEFVVSHQHRLFLNKKTTEVPPSIGLVLAFVSIKVISDNNTMDMRQR
jgi:hypothetical protein